MLHFIKHFGAQAVVVLVLGLALCVSLPSQQQIAEIEIEGVPSQVDPESGTLTIEKPTKLEIEGPTDAEAPFNVTTTDRTSFEDRRDRNVSRDEFFSALHPNDVVKVDGFMQGDKIVAKEIEIE